MQNTVDEIARVIMDRTAEGKDYMNRAFEPYSESYAKKKLGKTATGRPNLKRTGTMLHNIIAKADSPRKGRVDILPGAEPGGDGMNSRTLANIHNTGTGKQPQREFMNVSTAQVKRITKKYWDDPIGALAKAFRFGRGSTPWKPGARG